MFEVYTSPERVVTLFGLIVIGTGAVLFGVLIYDIISGIKQIRRRGK